jgi:hypothetical protein
MNLLVFIWWEHPIVVEHSVLADRTQSQCTAGILQIGAERGNLKHVSCYH